LSHRLQSPELFVNLEERRITQGIAEGLQWLRQIPHGKQADNQT
jgi:hypothetical protein